MTSPTTALDSGFASTFTDLPPEYPSRADSPHPSDQFIDTSSEHSTPSTPDQRCSPMQQFFSGFTSCAVFDGDLDETQVNYNSLSFSSYLTCYVVQVVASFS